ncbi:protein zer-1 homolog [Hyalella azteca]|uniref:Protein zer-1 homolog n=1 Tax=Hyalella azteca TaxID=294128 RepID=A0A8B7NR12_HYAAZ|nr:protein zer-1 homolog [Hyalella azteca]
MTAGAQGHPGWVDNHPTTLKFLAAAQTCLHPHTYTISSKKDHEKLSEDSTSNSINLAADDSETLMEDSLDNAMEIVEKNVIHQFDKTCESDVFLDIAPEYRFPLEISELLLSIFCTHYPNKANSLNLSIFRHPEKCKIRKALLRGCNADDDCVKYFFQHQLTHLDVRDCKYISSTSFYTVQEKGHHLQSLAVGSGFFDDVPKSKLSLNMPDLRSLVINNAFISDESLSGFMKQSNFKNLRSLDLSGSDQLDDLSPFVSLPLINLTLHNCNASEDWLLIIPLISNLRRLDISRSKNQNCQFANSDVLLEKIVENLPNLTYLDISGTNLCGTKKTQPVFDGNGSLIGHTDIPALRCRVGRPLEVLGLCHTTEEACKWPNLPAIKVLGDANELQILETVEVLMPCKEQVTTALNELFHQFRYETVQDVQRAMRLIFQAMTLYHFDEHVQISGSASLFYIMRLEADSQDHPVVTAAARQQMVTLMINAMERFPHDNILMRNGCLTISQLKVPQQVVFEYERLVSLLLVVIRHRGNVSNSTSNNERDMADFVCRISIYLLNSLACQVEGQHRQLVGDLGAVETMLCLISDKLKTKTHDDMLELAWSVMWNVTDETPRNCQRFLDGSGMTYFSDCLQTFKEHEDLLRNMMGLLGNVAEVRHLRCRLLTPELIDTFTGLLKSSSGGIEVSYNAAGVLSHIASDGPETWVIERPKRDVVLAALTSAINKWDIEVRRNINYRSFEPILRLLAVKHTPQCQHWAAWALANLTRVYPDKYCNLVVSEGGLEILERVRQETDAAQIRRLAQTVIAHCHAYKEDGNLDKLYSKAVLPEP